VIAAFRTPSPRIRTYVEHFAPGVVAAVAAAELLPAAVKGRSAIAIVVGFGLGTLAMLLIATSARELKVTRKTRRLGRPSRGGPAMPSPGAARWAWWRRSPSMY